MYVAALACPSSAQRRGRLCNKVSRFGTAVQVHPLFPRISLHSSKLGPRSLRGVILICSTFFCRPFQKRKLFVHIESGFIGNLSPMLVVQQWTTATSVKKFYVTSQQPARFKTIWKKKAHTCGMPRKGTALRLAWVACSAALFGWRILRQALNASFWSRWL